MKRKLASSIYCAHPKREKSQNLESRRTAHFYTVFVYETSKHGATMISIFFVAPMEFHHNKKLKSSCILFRINVLIQLSVLLPLRLLYNDHHPKLGNCRILAITQLYNYRNIPIFGMNLINFLSHANRQIFINNLIFYNKHTSSKSPEPGKWGREQEKCRKPSIRIEVSSVKTRPGLLKLRHLLKPAITHQ